MNSFDGVLIGGFIIGVMVVALFIGGMVYTTNFVADPFCVANGYVGLETAYNTGPHFTGPYWNMERINCYKFIDHDGKSDRVSD